LDTAKPPIIIFANEKRSVDALAKVIEKWGWKVGTYHGSKNQQ
jgi:ATP-dependent RNA helicase DDX23/PRP28